MQKSTGSEDQATDVGVHTVAGVDEAIASMAAMLDLANMEPGILVPACIPTPHPQLPTLAATHATAYIMRTYAYAQKDIGHAVRRCKLPQLKGGEEYGNALKRCKRVYVEVVNDKPAETKLKLY